MRFRPYFKHSRFKHSTVGTNYTPKQLAAFYGFNNVGDGAGHNIGFIELGGAVNQKDLDTYFHSLGLSVLPKPVVVHLVAGGTNTSDGPDGADGEVMLDHCVGGGMAPGAQLHCFQAPNTDAGFLAAIKAARLAFKAGDAISISWGAAEDQWDPATVAAFNAEFQACASAGITVTAAAGDNGSGDGEKGKHVDFPASSPWVLGCGGTSLKTTNPIDEEVWNDGSAGGATGGGVSALHVIPAYQTKANVPGGKFRGVPDVAGVADPNTGWIVMVDGQQMVIGGTSAVAPMWAALAVILSQATGKPMGFMNPVVYGLPAGCFRDIVLGNNGTYIARAGYDCNTGNGVPNAAKIFAAVTAGAPPSPVPSPVPVPVPSTSHTLVLTGQNLVMTIDGKTV